MNERLKLSIWITATIVISVCVIVYACFISVIALYYYMFLAIVVLIWSVVYNLLEP
jgi:hypothetical protein